MAQNNEVWKALSSQISKSMKTQMGISIPGLGQFGFTPSSLPIFIASDSFNLSPCTLENGQFKPFSGSISTHASFNLQKFSLDLKCPSDSARILLETVLAQFKSRTSQDTKQEIPGVGTLLIKNRTIALSATELSRKPLITEDAAAWLNSNLGLDLGHKSRPRTGSQRGSARSIPISVRNAQSFRPASVQSETSVSQVLHSRSTGNFRSDRTTDIIVSNMAKIMLTCQARDQSNRGLLGLAEFLQVIAGIDAGITETQIHKLILSTNSGTAGKVRYRVLLEGLARGGKSKFSSQVTVASDVTENYNKFTLAPIAKLIWEKKLVITEISQNSGMRPRIEVQPSELLVVLKKSGVFINIHQLKAILKETQACSVLELLRVVKLLCLPGEQFASSYESARPYSGFVADTTVDKLRNYLGTYNLSEIFQAAAQGAVLHVDDFVNYITEQSYGKVKALEAQQAFFRVSHDIDQIYEADFCKGFSRYESPRQIQERGFKILRNWLRQEKLSTEQGFDYLLQASKSSQFLNYESWISTMRMFEFNLYESSVIFDAIDTKQDKMIDLAEWLNKVYEDEGPLQSFKDTVIKYKIDKEDLLIKLNAHSKQRLSVEEMAEALRRMDPTLTVTNAVNMARSAAGSKGYIDVQDFLAQLSQQPEEFQGNWKEGILRKIQVKVRGSVDRLRKILEEADYKNIGRLDLVKFQECISLAGLGLDSIEIERLGRVLDRKNNLTVDYNEFLDNLEGPNLPPQDPLKSTAARLQMFLKQNDITANHLLKKLGAKVSIARFSSFLRKKVHKKFPPELLDEIAEKFDVNKDGFIDINDLMAILSSKTILNISTGNTYPTRALSPDRARVVIKDIRTALVSKKVNYYDAFSAIDSDSLGVLSAKQFSDGLDKYIELSEPVKYGLFALIDKLGTGLITYEAFLAVIKDNDRDPRPHKDTWTWENETIDRIRKWIRSENISVENAFRAFDVDFDGVISKEDLKLGLITVLKLQTKECPSSKLDRLYKLLDSFKRNSIQLSDFKLLFEENSNPEWKTGAKQQVGLYLSRNYANIKLAFEAVSELTGKIKLEQFVRWVECNQILRGFNLTQQLLEKLFAELDPHRKAYLTESDWENAFGGINYKDQCLKEIKDAVRSNFSDLRSAFEHFTSYHRPQPCASFLLADFQQGISSLVPKRFSPSEIEAFWKVLWSTPQVNFHDFSLEFSDVRFLSTFSQVSKRSSNHSTPISYLSYSSTASQDPLKRLQSLVKASPNNLEEVFKNIDVDESGKLSAVEFRKALRKLGIGLSARDIDTIMSRIDTNNDGQIDWLEFQKNFKISETEKYTSGLAQNRIQRMRQNMSHYMLSPKDAFLQFDPERSGVLDFGKFTGLVNRLCELAGESVPVFSVLKDLYDIIDIRKDGVVDMREWLNTFKGEAKTWEDSKEFDDISKIIARNRKLLQITFDAMSRNGRVEVAQAREILGSVLRGVKIADEAWGKIIGVAIREGTVDYRFLLDIYKDRAIMKQWHPRPK